MAYCACTEHIATVVTPDVEISKKVCTAVIARICGVGHVGLLANGRTNGQTDDMMMPTADHIAKKLQSGQMTRI